MCGTVFPRDGPKRLAADASLMHKIFTRNINTRTDKSEVKRHKLRPYTGVVEICGGCPSVVDIDAPKPVVEACRLPSPGVVDIAPSVAVVCDGAFAPEAAVSPAAAVVVRKAADVPRKWPRLLLH
jgi:hypothetical protein